MSLLDTASLIVTPNAYKEGKLYSVIPSDGSGDLSVTRATTATRVNSAGLVELVPYNLATWSQDFSNANWVKSSSSVVSNSTTAPDGTLTADTQIVSAQFGGFNQYIDNLSTGSTYTISFWAKKLTGTNTYSVIDNSGGSGIIGTFTPTTEWVRYTFSFTAASAAMTLFPAQDRNASGFGSIYIWGAQLNEGTLKDYQRTETRLNIPRLDYSNGSCPSILVEPQRTNLFAYSEQFDNSYWAKIQVSVTPNSAISPDGNLTADKLIPSATPSVNKYLVKTISSTASTAYTFTIYAKAAEYDKIQIQYGDLGIGVWFDLSNGTVLSNPNTLPTFIENLNNGWYRVSITFTPISLIMSPVIQASNSADGSVGNGTSGIFIWGAQIEAGSYPTSYIPTTSASVTRNGDVINRDNVYTNNWITANGGTWFLDLKNTIPYIRSTSNFGLFLSTIDNGFGGNGFVFYNNTSASQRPVLAKYVSGTITVLATLSSNTSKIAIKWNGSTADIFENGIKIISATAFTGTSMQYISNQLLPIPFNINAMALWPTPLTDDELTALTTI
jgi:hypothetical protein